MKSNCCKGHMAIGGTMISKFFIKTIAFERLNFLGSGVFTKELLDFFYVLVKDSVELRFHLLC